MNRLHVPIVQRTFRRSLNIWLDAVAQRRADIDEGVEGAREALARLAIAARASIGKPFNPDVIRARVRSLLQRETPR